MTAESLFSEEQDELPFLQSQAQKDESGRPKCGKICLDSILEPRDQYLWPYGDDKESERPLKVNFRGDDLKLVEKDVWELLSNKYGVKG